MSKKKWILGLAVMLAAASLAFSGPGVDPGPNASGKVRAPAANLEVEILESNSSFVNHIYLVSPGPELFIGTDDEWGTVKALPTVAPNTELIFEIRVFDGADDTGMRWRTGPPSRNVDNKFHAVLGMLGVDQIQVNFEDIHGDGWGVEDEPNFVDAVFVMRPAP